MKQRRKKRKHVRKQDWLEAGEFAFSRDLKRHRHTDTAISDAAAQLRTTADFEPNAVVLSTSKKHAFVLQDGQERLCLIAENLMDGRASLLVTGDQVLVEESDGEGVVVLVKERATKLSRLVVEHARTREQVIAANVDNLVIVTSVAKPMFKQGVVDRYLISAQIGGVRPILCLNKVDLAEKEPEAIQSYRDMGITVVRTSCATGEGIEALRDAIKGGVSVFAGQSGVGKSSLLNALEPSLGLETQEVSRATEKGKHTTTTARLYDLGDGIRVIDTPGVRALGLWGVSVEEVGFYFPDFAEYAAQCRFRDCTHVHEPDCAVLRAVEDGAISVPRYESYLRILDSVEEQTKRY